MFPKGKASTVPSDNQAKEKLANYVYEYLIHIGATKAANSFLQEIHWEKSWPIGEPPGFLNQWWCVFYDLYSAAPERRETFEHSSEAKAFHDYGFVNSGFPNGMSRNPSIASPISGGMPPSGGRPPSSQGIIPPDNGIHTPVSMQGGQMMVPSGHFFAPNHPISNPGGPGMDPMRGRALMHPIRFSQGGGGVGPMGGVYHPGQAMSRHRYNQPPSGGIAHSPGPPQQGGPPNDLQQQQNEVSQQNTSGQDAFSSRSPCHVMSQPAPAFPPPPASENGDGGPSAAMNGSSAHHHHHQQQQQQQQQSHTMEYLPSGGGGGGGNFDPPSLVGMKHSPQMHGPSMSEVIASMGNGDFCGAGMMPGGPDHGGGGRQHLMPPLSQIHLMQQGLAAHHGPLSMQQLPPGPLMPGPFMPHSGGGPLSAGPQFPDYGFTSMSQAI